MTGGDDRLFAEACGVRDPLRLQWEDPASGTPVQVELGRPAAVVGRNGAADLVVSDPQVAPRQAYLQVVDGRLFAIDLEGRGGLRWGGVPRASGWLDPRRPAQVGPVSLRLVPFDESNASDPPPGPGPTSRRYVSEHPLPEVWLEAQGPGEPPRRSCMDRVLALVGSAESCQLRFADEGVSRFVCGLVRTPAGVWAVDLLSKSGLIVNGMPCRTARLEDGDTVRVGRRQLRITYGAATAPPASRHDANLPAEIVRARPELARLSPAFAPLLESADATAANGSSPFGQALLMLVGLLGEMHREHLDLVREELKQLRRLNREITAARATPTKAVGPTPANGLPELPAVPLPPSRPDPQTAAALANERLRAWERERQSRWRRIVELLSSHG